MKKDSKAKSSLIKPDVEVVESVEAELYKRVRSYIAKARAKVYAVANKEMVSAYWNVGREIVEKQGGVERAKYGDGLIKELSLKLTAEFGPGYTSTNLKYMRLVFLAFPRRRNCKGNSSVSEPPSKKHTFLLCRKKRADRGSARGRNSRGQDVCDKGIGNSLQTPGPGLQFPCGHSPF